MQYYITRHWFFRFSKNNFCKSWKISDSKKQSFQVRTIEELLLQYVDCLKRICRFSEEILEGESEEKVPASALLWTYYFLAQHYDHLRDTEKALSYIDAAIEHTPTLIELFVAKGRIYKHAGDPAEAFKWLDEAQALDTADR